MIVTASTAAVNALCGTNVWVAIGNWDGVHLGHQSIIHELVTGARAAGARSVVIGFYPHPMVLLRPAAAPLSIQSLSERSCDLAAMGVDMHLVLPFSHEFAATAPEAFVEQVLMCGVGARQVMVGFNFTFGRGGRGTAQTLANQCALYRVPVRIFEPVRVAGETVSSTVVRYFLAAGEVERVRELLGHPFRFVGPVVAGDQRGRLLGYPTANLELTAGRQLPAHGVYAVRVTALDQADLGCPDLPAIWPATERDTWEVPGCLTGQIYGGMLNLGMRPTFQGQELRCEVHLLDFQGDLYGRRLQIEFVQRLRPEMAFPDVDALVGQLKQDEAAARTGLRRWDPTLGV